ncbi:MAG: hypothetical protein DWI66_02495 [Candidatus Aquidulcis sp.]|nr:MAG: hypothetical protein DWI66_02495 [Candidatus Aquidulcis sp.]
MFATLLDPAAFSSEPESNAAIHFVECPELTAAEPTSRDHLAERMAALAGVHRALLPVGGNLVGMNRDEWLQIPAESLVINPIRDPESWRAAATWPGDRGLILALVPAPGDEDPEPVEILLWAVRYAASLGGRGLDRVGVAGMLPIAKGAPDPAEAEKRIALLERLVELSAANEETLRAELDPRAFQPIERPRR